MAITTTRFSRTTSGPSTYQRGRDGTRYSRFHPTNFLAHHLARIVTAAVLSDAEHIADGIIGLKQRAHDLALADETPTTLRPRAPSAAAQHRTPPACAARPACVCV